MKRNHILTAVLLVLLLTLALAACASAAEVRPIPVDHDKVDPANGTFNLQIRSADRIETNGYFIAVLYLEDHYDPEQIRSLAPGDAVYVNNKKWTVKETVIHREDGEPEETAVVEVYTEEELGGYLAFAPCGDGTFQALINDWSPVTLAGSVIVRMPLPDAFEFVAVSAGEEDDPGDANVFVEYLDRAGPETVSPYNTTCVFEGGLLTKVTCYSYPYGPEEGDGTEPEFTPVWQFCHGFRDGLDTAVITGYETDCEEGPHPVELTPEETEKIRRLAMYGVITGKENDMSLTGGTWVYSFATPNGTHLLSIEVYQGMIATDDGMYSYRIEE